MTDKRDYAGAFTLAEEKVSNSSDPSLERLETVQTAFDAAPTQLYKDGVLVAMPAPTRDPRDPMNLPFWRKLVGLVCLSFFGALIASAELILGAALPIFAFEYAGVPYQSLAAPDFAGYPVGSNPLLYLETLSEALHGPPIFKTYLLATMPVLMIGVANLFLVPMAISVGRRPVVIATGLLAVGGAVWASKSTSLDSHIAARCIQAIGAGSVESLIPFIIQDIIQVHQRNAWISMAFACQGVIIIAIGFSSTYIIIDLTWRWLYDITAILASFFLLGVILFLPETRYKRTRSEMNGVPRDDAGVEYRPSSYLYEMRIFSGYDWAKGVKAFWDTMRTFFYPSILFVTLLNGSVIAAVFAAGFTAAPALLTQPWAWNFYRLGLCLVPVLIGAVAAGILVGPVADYFANAVAKRRGERHPENQLINLILPWTLSWLGSLLFGLAGQDQTKYHWMVFMVALAFLSFGFLGTSSVTTVYVLECYPNMAGPALVNVASFRWIMAFLLTLFASDWIVDWGYLHTYTLYTAFTAFFGLGIPFVYYFGPAWRERFPGDKPKNRRDDDIM